MNIKIRKVKASDWPAMKKLTAGIWAFHRPLFRKIDPSFVAFSRSTSRKKFLKWARQRKTYFIVAVDDTAPVGYLLAGIRNYPDDRKLLIGHLAQIFVIPKYRGKGVSDLLWKDTLKWFKMGRVKFLQLNVVANNVHAIKFYKKWGLKPYMLMMNKKL
ncbi:MAG: GNAT family N-acetyltransferase [Patescibacteria group bacterium]|nr:GNAT family N-acetyltransferase [Patescibacteria group bacterium]